MFNEIFKKFNKKQPESSIEKTMLDVKGYSRSLPRLSKREVMHYYLKSPMLRTCVSKISESISTNQWNVFRINTQGKKILIKNADVDRVMKTFNPLFSTGVDGWFLVQSFLETHGNAYIHKERDSTGKVIYLWTYNPLDVEELPGVNNNYCYKININGQYHLIPMTEIIHIKNPNPLDPFGFGIGMAETLINEVQTSDLAKQQVNQYFYNGAIPPYIISADITPEQLKQMQSNWITSNQGWFNRNKPYFTNTTSMNVQRLTDSFKEMDLVRLVNLDSEIIRKSYGIPPEILGGVDNSNRATIQGAREIYAREVLMPRLLKLQDVLNTNLINEFGDFTLEYSSPVPSDNQLMLDTMKAFPDNFTEEEIRSLAGLMPL